MEQQRKLDSVVTTSISILVMIQRKLVWFCTKKKENGIDYPTFFFGLVYFLLSLYSCQRTKQRNFLFSFDANPNASTSNIHDKMIREPSFLEDEEPVSKPSSEQSLIGERTQRPFSVSSSSSSSWTNASSYQSYRWGLRFIVLLVFVFVIVLLVCVIILSIRNNSTVSLLSFWDRFFCWSIGFSQRKCIFLCVGFFFQGAWTTGCTNIFPLRSTH